MKKLIAAVTTAGLLIAGAAGMAQAAETPNQKAPAHAAAGRGQRIRAAVQVAATAIGIEPKALGEAVRSGQSVADVARSHDVDPQKVIDAVVAAANKKIDAAVDSRKLDATRAATIKARLADRVTKVVNATPRERGAGSS